MKRKRRKQTPPKRRTLRHFEPAELTNRDRLEALYAAAVADGVIDDSEARRLDFFAAAVQAVRKGKVPARLFAHIVNRGQWHTITSESEEGARRMMRPKRHRESNAGPVAIGEILNGIRT